MGHTNETPELLLSGFVDTDKPTWRGDYNSDMIKIDEFANGVRQELDQIPLEYVKAFLPEKYGAVGDGIANDTAAIQAALDAAFAEGGGTVLLRNRYGWTGDILHRGGVSVQGTAVNRVSSANAPLTDPDESALVALNATARYLYGRFTSPGSVDDNPGPLNRVVFDGRNLSTQLVKMEAVDGSITECRIINANGTALEVGGSQNGTVERCLIGHANGVNGRAISFDTAVADIQGAGSMKFRDLYLADSKVHLYATTSPTNFPAHDIFFENCLLETYTNGNDLVKLRAGSFTFRGCVFTNSVDNAEGFPAQGSLISVRNDIITAYGTNAIFESCYFNGGGGPALAKAINVICDGVTNVIVVNSFANLYNLTALVHNDVGINYVDIQGNIYPPGQVSFSDSSDGNGFGFFHRTDSPTLFTDLGVENTHPPIRVSRATDTGYRFSIDKDGIFRWFDGTDVVNVQASLAYNNATDDIVAGGRWRFGNAVAYTSADAVIAADGQAVEFAAGPGGSPSFSLNWILNDLTANVTITGGVAGARISVIINSGATTGGDIIWPANVNFIGGISVQPVAGEIRIIDFVFFGGEWHEIGR